VTPITVRRRSPAYEAMQWDGTNTDEVVKWFQGGWKDDGIWLKQTFQSDAPVNPVWYMVVPVDGESEIAVGGYIVKEISNEADVFYGRKTRCGSAEWFEKEFEPLNKKET